MCGLPNALWWCLNVHARASPFLVCGQAEAAMQATIDDLTARLAETQVGDR